jgi:hypothetical protein
MQLATVVCRARCISCTLALHKQPQLSRLCINASHSQYLPNCSVALSSLWPAAIIDGALRSHKHSHHESHACTDLVLYTIYNITLAICAHSDGERGQMKLEELNKCLVRFIISWCACVCVCATPAWPLKTSARGMTSDPSYVFLVSARHYSVFLFFRSMSHTHIYAAHKKRKRVVSFRVGCSESRFKRHTKTINKNVFECREIQWIGAII